jgi:hypothetical protein
MDMSGGNWIAAAALGALLLPQVAQADYWRYETETGGIAFTDDKKSIPTKYQAGAKAVKEESLFDYGRLSVIHPVSAGDATRAGVRATEPAVPVFAWPVNAPVADAPVEDPDTRVRINVGGMQFDVNSEDGEEPLYVDRGQYTDLEGNYIEHGGIMRPTTIIRRGDVPIAYIDETE